MRDDRAGLRRAFSAGVVHLFSAGAHARIAQAGTISAAAGCQVADKSACQGGADLGGPDEWQTIKGADCRLKSAQDGVREDFLPLDPARSHGRDEVSLKYSYRRHAAAERSGWADRCASAGCCCGPDGWQRQANGPD